MGSYIRLIDCSKCGNTHGYIDDDYKEGIKTTGCDNCGYKKVKHYKVKRLDNDNK